MVHFEIDMKEGTMKKFKLKLGKVSDFMITCVFMLFFALFIITLVGVVFIGNRLDYFEICKITCLLDNKIIFLVAVVLLGIWTGLGCFIRRIPFNKTGEYIAVFCIALIFTGMYFAGVEVSKCIAFYSGWDVSIVSGSAYNLFNNSGIEDFWYYSVYPNNVPICYFLYKLYDWAWYNPDYAYNAEFAWIQCNNLLMCVAGFASCMTVKRLTHKLFPVITCLLLYIVCAFITPWRIIPYTDMLAFAFPILSICFYVYSATARNAVWKYILFLLAGLFCAIGSIIKPPVLIVLFAVIIMELLVEKNWREIVIKALLLVCVLFFRSSYTEYIYEETEFIQNQEITATYHHYFLMGLNEESTGGYYSPDFAMFGQYATAGERIDAEIELAWERICDKGVLGYPYFLFKKLVMCFNDGTFCWGKEGGFYFGDYQNLTDAGYKQLFRDIFWPDYRYCGRFNTFSQLSWFLVLGGILGNILYIKSEKKYLVGVVILTILGSMFYLMLFEARSRYLLCFLSVWITFSAMGVDAILDILAKKIDERRNKKKMKDKECI